MGSKTFIAVDILTYMQFFESYMAAVLLLNRFVAVNTLGMDACSWFPDRYMRPVSSVAFCYPPMYENDPPRFMKMLVL